MKLKSLEEFLNESYTGSMSSIIVKMKNEMKSAQVIYQYLFTLGVDPIRIQEEMRKHGPYAIEYSSEYKINSDKHKNPEGFSGPSGRMTGVNEGEILEKRKIMPFKKVKVGMMATDVYGDQYKVLHVGKAKNLKQWDQTGFAFDEPNADAVVIGNSTAQALLAYGEDGAVVYEAFDIEKDRSRNYKWIFKIKSYTEDKVGKILQGGGFKELTKAGIEFGTSPEGMMIMGDSEEEKKKAIKLLDDMGITESHYIFEEGELEDELNQLEDDLEKTKDETEINKDDSEEPAENQETEKKEDALKGAISDIEKLEKIRKILAESFDLDGVEDDILEKITDYHLTEKMSEAEKEKLKDEDFIFPEEKSWPIHDEKHAKTALIWATWPQNKDIKSKIVKEVLKRYPNLKGYGAAK